MDLKKLTVHSSAIYFDLETDGLLDELTKIHTIGMSTPDAAATTTGPEKAAIDHALGILESADVIIGQNIIGYDIPAIQKLYPNWKPSGIVIDTLVLSRLAYPNLQQLDFTRASHNLPRNLYGSSSLKAWGYRLGKLKGDYGDKQGAWDAWSEEMDAYCRQDVEVTKTLTRHLVLCDISDKAAEMEHHLQTIICQQERHGFLFDVEKAQKLAAVLGARRDALLEQLQASFPPKPEKLIGPYENQKARMLRLLEHDGYALDSWQEPDVRKQLEWSGIKFKWEKEQAFNPNSEKQIVERLQEMGWEAKEYTNKGQPKMDEPILEEVGQQFPKAQPLVEYSLISKRLGQIAEGRAAWLKMVKDDGRMHGRCNTMGTITYRFTHSSPNMGQVPGVRAAYGKECRSFFRVPDGYRLVGCDVSGLELRLLAHYMSRWDNGEYAKIILEGDIHTRNQETAGLTTRDQAKTFIYAFLYGAGDGKLGSIAKPDEKSDTKLRKLGKELRRRFMSKTPALDRLAQAVRVKAAKHKKLEGLDGRKIIIRSAHSALNALIQSAGSIATKTATVRFRHLMEGAGHRMPDDWCLVAHVHDEWQTEVKESIADETARLAVQSIEEAGDILNLRCPITGEARVGSNWAETH
jgi:DNA polymerase I-like protein with 3'-5' exonuclease and polymerase domains